MELLLFKVFKMCTLLHSSYIGTESLYSNLDGKFNTKLLIVKDIPEATRAQAIHIIDRVHCTKKVAIIARVSTKGFA